MKSLRTTFQKEGRSSSSLRAFMQDYGTNSLKTLFVGVAIHQGDIAFAALPGGRNLIIEKSPEKNTVRILSQDNTGGQVDIPKDKLGENNSDKAVKEIAQKLFKYFQEKADDIQDGKIKAADIGGAIYGIAAATILTIFAPFAAVGTILSPIFSSAFSIAAKGVGEYYGAIVDDFVSLLKNENNSTISDVVGTMATVMFSQIIFDVPGGPLRFLGIDGWAITKKIGQEVGDNLEKAIQEIDEITGGIVSSAADEVEEFFNKLVSSIF
jgi:hypothetical protein